MKNMEHLIPPVLQRSLFQIVKMENILQVRGHKLRPAAFISEPWFRFPDVFCTPPYLPPPKKVLVSYEPEWDMWEGGHIEVG